MISTPECLKVVNENYVPGSAPETTGNTHYTMTYKEQLFYLLKCTYMEKLFNCKPEKINVGICPVSGVMLQVSSF